MNHIKHPLPMKHCIVIILLLITHNICILHSHASEQTKTIIPKPVADLTTIISDLTIGTQPTTPAPDPPTPDTPTKSPSLLLRSQAGIIFGNSDKLPLVTDSYRWFKGSSANLARIPRQVFESLEGRKYSSFSSLKQAFWRRVNKHPVLVTQLLAIDPHCQKRLKNGLAPRSLPGQNWGKRVYYQLHHIVFISRGGGIYDLNNLFIVTPLYHMAYFHNQEQHKA